MPAAGGLPPTQGPLPQLSLSLLTGRGARGVDQPLGIFVLRKEGPGRQGTSAECRAHWGCTTSADAPVSRCLSNNPAPPPTAQHCARFLGCTVEQSVLASGLVGSTRGSTGGGGEGEGGGGEGGGAGGEGGGAGGEGEGGGGDGDGDGASGEGEGLGEGGGGEGEGGGGEGEGEGESGGGGEGWGQESSYILRLAFHCGVVGWAGEGLVSWGSEVQGSWRQLAQPRASRPHSVPTHRAARVDVVLLLDGAAHIGLGVARIVKQVVVQLVGAAFSGRGGRVEGGWRLEGGWRVEGSGCVAVQPAGQAAKCRAAPGRHHTAAAAARTSRRSWTVWATLSSWRLGPGTWHQTAHSGPCRRSCRRVAGGWRRVRRQGQRTDASAAQLLRSHCLRRGAHQSKNLSGGCDTQSPPGAGLGDGGDGGRGQVGSVMKLAALSVAGAGRVVAGGGWGWGAGDGRQGVKQQQQTARATHVQEGGGEAVGAGSTRGCTGSRTVRAARSGQRTCTAVLERFAAPQVTLLRDVGAAASGGRGGVGVRCSRGQCACGDWRLGRGSCEHQPATPTRPCAHSPLIVNPLGGLGRAAAVHVVGALIGTLGADRRGRGRRRGWQAGGVQDAAIHLVGAAGVKGGGGPLVARLVLRGAGPASG